MKLFTFLFSGLLVSILFVNAQDYQTVRSGRVTYFTTYQNVIKASKIDSVNFDRDSVLYPMPHIQQLDYRCFTPRGHSWMGEKVIIQSNGVNLFFNNEKDTIRINTRAKVGESWTLFEIKDSVKIIAEVKSVELQAVLGQTDSVKTIGFSVYDKNGLAADQFLYGKTIVFSKNYGFVKTMSFNEFPVDRDLTYYENLEAYDLVGLTNPARGIQNLTWLDVNDHQVGDELHILNNSWDWNNTPGHSYTHKTRLKYLERIESGDSLFYRIEIEESVHKRIGRWDSTAYVYSHDTITRTFKPDTLFDKLPGEPIIENEAAYVYSMFLDELVLRKFKFEPVIHHGSDDNCWYRIIYDGGGPGYYLKGLGGPYNEWNNIISGEEERLVYYKKGSTTWGTPLIITSVKNLEKEDQIKVYPNPADDFVTIENRSGKAGKYIISLTDIQGREVLKNETAISTTYKVDLSLLKPGAYLLKLQHQETQFSKVIIKKP